MNTLKILVVEDDLLLAEQITDELVDFGYVVTDTVSNSEGAIGAFRKRLPDLVLMDINLEGSQLDGIQLAHEFNKIVRVPIIFLTARSEEIDRVLGLEIGADDYITKPFSIREVIARVKAIFRRSNIKEQTNGDHSNSKNELKYGDLEIDIEKRKITLANKRITLSPKEFELLTLMASKPGKSYSRSDLLKLIWGYDFRGYEHTVNSHINRLRSKIEEDMNKPKYILTTWGVGYRFNEDIL